MPGQDSSSWRNCVRLAILAVFLLTVVPVRSVNARPGAQKSPVHIVSISIDAHAPIRPFPHFWEQMFGSGRATLSLRASYRRDLRQVKRATGFEYIRFHGIFDDDTGFYSETPQGAPLYNFSYIDQIYDGLLKNHVHPFVELSFMPKALASTNQRNGFWYHPYVSPPKDWSRWGSLVQRFARHLVARYGINEVSQWYFEVWNEPNLDFWAGRPKQQTYFHLYDVTARALKQVSPRLRVGGPATAQAAWIPSFIRHCAANHVPVDFISTHVYGNDSAENVFGKSVPVSRKDMVILAVRKVHREVKASTFPDLPIIFSEYNAAYDNDPHVTDSAFMGPWLADTIRQCDGLVKMMSYWTFSDVFEEQGVVKKPFYGGFGLIAEDGIHKAAFNDFWLLHKLGTQRLGARGDSVLATRRSDGALAIAVWNYAPARGGGAVKVFNFSFKNLAAPSRAIVWIVDAHHGSPLDVWKQMGRPDFPSRTQIRLLREAGRTPEPRIRPLNAAEPNLSLTLAPYGLALVEIQQGGG